MSEAGFRSHARGAAARTLAIGVGGGLTAAAFGAGPAGLGLAAGATAGAIALRLHAADLIACARLSAAAAARRDWLGRAGRFVIRGAALALAVIRPELSIGWTAVGLLLATAVLVGLEWREGRAETA